MRRVLAVLVAVLMIGGAIWGRHRLDDRSTTTDAGSTSGTAGGTIVCVPELEAVCQDMAHRHTDLKIRIEDAQTTLTALGGADFDPGRAGAADGTSSGAIDAWLVPQPWPDMVAEQRQRTGASPSLDDTTATLARTPLVMAIWNDRRAALASRCPQGDITWSCIGDVAGSRWGDTGETATWGPVKPGHPTPASTATGLLVLGQATASRLGTAGYASNDFSSSAFRTWFERLERAIPSFPKPPRTPVDDMLFTGPASFDLAGSLEAVSGPAVTSSRDAGRLSVLYPTPVTTADVVLAPVAGSKRGDRLARLFTSGEAAAALARAGWRVDGQPTIAGVDGSLELPATSNVPRAGVLQALRALWTEVIR